MIRTVHPSDTAAITAIYNEYVRHSVISFETVPLSEKEMEERITGIAADFPYLVYETGEGELAGFCYAHPWKERAAYGKTLETTIYLAPGFQRRGIGMQLMTRLIEECRKRGFHALIACITGGNEASCALHERLGFRKVSSFSEVGLKFGIRLDVVDYELIL